MEKSIKNATHTKGGHKILRCEPIGNQFSVTVEDKTWAAGHVTYLLGVSGKHQMNAYSIKPV